MVIRVVFLGTPNFAVPSLRQLIRDDRFEVRGVITQPDRPAGRGQKVTAPPVKKEALESGLPVFQPVKLRKDPEALELLSEWAPALMVVVAFGQILPPSIFEFPRHGTLNVHASLLPAYRGANPVMHALLHGEKKTGVTIMKIDEGMDTGDILSQREVSIHEEMNAGQLADRLATAGAQLLIDTIESYLEGRLRPWPQDHSKASYAPKIDPREARLDWQELARVIHNRIRAFNPWPGAFCFLKAERIKVWSSRALEDGGKAVPGTILKLESEGIVVQSGAETRISLLTLQRPGRKRVSGGDLARGLDLRVGDQFH